MDYSSLCDELKLEKPKKSMSEAIFDEDGKKRYLLEIRWGKKGKVLGGFMMNPSHASHLKSDPTINQLVEYAQKHQYVALIVVNAIAFIEPESNQLDNSRICESDPTNWAFVEKAFSQSDCIFFAPGVKGQKALNNMIDSGHEKVVDILKKYRDKFYCYELAQNSDLYYIPHLRPQKKLNKYKEWELKKLSKFEGYENIFRE